LTTFVSSVGSATGDVMVSR